MRDFFPLPIHFSAVSRPRQESRLTLIFMKKSWAKKAENWEWIAITGNFFSYDDNDDTGRTCFFTLRLECGNPSRGKVKITNGLFAYHTTDGNVLLSVRVILFMGRRATPAIWGGGTFWLFSWIKKRISHKATLLLPLFLLKRVKNTW